MAHEQSTVYVAGQTAPVSLTEVQQAIRDDFKAALAEWLGVNGYVTTLALTRHGMSPTTADDTLADAVQELSEQGWRQYLDTVQE